ncbi:MAG: hypothetical protein Q4A00_07880 [Flavobacteriaceae bacterium]|nr:hypothetical protein [Flavobacteriaceae bacterium]
MDDIKEGEVVEDIPNNLKEWLKDNREKIGNAKSVPWWLGENEGYWRKGKKYEINKTLRRAKDKELKEWVRQNIPEKNLVVKGNQFKNNEIIINRAGAKSVYSHFTEPHLKDMVKDIESIVKRSQFKSEAPLNKESHNYEKKTRAGFENFRYYISQYKGYNVRVNTVVIKGREFIYSVNILTIRKSL